MNDVDPLRRAEIVRLYRRRASQVGKEQALRETSSDYGITRSELRTWDSRTPRDPSLDATRA